MKKYEIRIGFHWNGDKFPVHNFEGVEDWEQKKDTKGVVVKSNEELHFHLEERWKKTPEREKLMYFYVQPFRTGLPV